MQMQVARSWVEHTDPGGQVPLHAGNGSPPEHAGSVVLVVVVTLHAVTQPAGAPSFDTLNVLASFGFGIAVAVPPQ